MTCPKCGATTQDWMKFCGICGGLQDANINLVEYVRKETQKEMAKQFAEKQTVEVIRLEIVKVIDAKYKSGEVVEIEVASKIEDRLEKWVKQRLWVSTALVVILGYLGIKSYTDFSRTINELTTKVTSGTKDTLDGLKLKSNNLTDSVETLATRNKKLLESIDQITRDNEKLKKEYKDRATEAEGIESQLAILIKSGGEVAKDYKAALDVRVISAVKLGYADDLTRALRDGGDPNATENGTTALALAKAENNPQIVSILQRKIEEQKGSKP